MTKWITTNDWLKFAARDGIATILLFATGDPYNLGYIALGITIGDILLFAMWFIIDEIKK